MKTAFWILLISIALLIYLKNKETTPLIKGFKYLLWGSTAIASVILIWVTFLVMMMFTDNDDRRFGDDFPCEGTIGMSLPDLTSCFVVKDKGKEYVTSEYVKGGTYYLVGDDEPYTGCAGNFDFFDGYTAEMCFKDGKPDGIWKDFKYDSKEIEKEVCYSKGKKQSSLSKCNEMTSND